MGGRRAGAKREGGKPTNSKQLHVEDFQTRDFQTRSSFLGLTDGTLPTAHRSSWARAGICVQRESSPARGPAYAKVYTCVCGGVGARACVHAPGRAITCRSRASVAAVPCTLVPCTAAVQRLDCALLHLSTEAPSGGAGAVSNVVQVVVRYKWS